MGSQDGGIWGGGRQEAIHRWIQELGGCKTPCKWGCVEEQDCIETHLCMSLLIRLDKYNPAPPLPDRFLLYLKWDRITEG